MYECIVPQSFGSLQEFSMAGVKNIAFSFTFAEISHLAYHVNNIVLYVTHCLKLICFFEQFLCLRHICVTLIIALMTSVFQGTGWCSFVISCIPYFLSHAKLMHLLLLENFPIWTSIWLLLFLDIRRVYFRFVLGISHHLLSTKSPFFWKLFPRLHSGQSFLSVWLYYHHS